MSASVASATDGAAPNNPAELLGFNGLFDAHKTLAPVLAIAAQIPSSEIGTDYFQETHPERLFLDCSHFCQLVGSEKQMPRLAQSAMQISVSRGGVSVNISTNREIETTLILPKARCRVVRTHKHAVREDLKQLEIQNSEAAAPTCQTRHMQEGKHEVRTAWGLLAVRLPMPEDKEWTADRATILQALGVLGPNGKPTKLLDFVNAADLARLDQASWRTEHDKMVKTCNQCHPVNFAKDQLHSPRTAGKVLSIQEPSRILSPALQWTPYICCKKRASSSSRPATHLKTKRPL